MLQNNRLDEFDLTGISVIKIRPRIRGTVQTDSITRVSLQEVQTKENNRREKLTEIVVKNLHIVINALPIIFRRTKTQVKNLWQKRVTQRIYSYFQ